ncbi:MAG TPA: sugar ABC transporter permease [Ktedonobacterales bacterium]
MQQAVRMPKSRRRFRLKPLQVREALAAYGFLAPYLVIVTVFMLIATVTALYLSFFYVNFGFTEPIWYGLRNYQIIWYDLTHNGDFGNSLVNAVKYTVGVVVVQTILALALALLLNSKVRGRGIFRTAFYLPALTSSVAISLIFIWLYNTGGALNWVLGLVGIPPQPWLNNPTTALPAIMALNIWTTAPTFMLVYLAALQDIPDTLFEAARIDGANTWNIIRHITIPLLRPTTFVVVALGTIGAFQVFDQVYVMQGTDCGPLRSTCTPVLIIYDTAFKSSLMGLACAEAIVLFIVIFTLTILQRRFIDANIQY